MPVLPLVESISVRVRSGPTRPRSMASRTMNSPARSLTLPPGFNQSSLAQISTPGVARSSERSRTIGVLPTACASASTFMAVPVAAERAARPPRRAPPATRGRRPRRNRRGRGSRCRTPPGIGPPSGPRGPFRGFGRRRRAGAPGLRRRARRAAGGARTAPAALPSTAPELVPSCFRSPPYRRPLTSGDGRHDGQLVALGKRGLERFAVPDVLVVPEDVHVPAQAPLLVEKPLAQAGIAAREVLHGGLDGGRVLDGHLALALGQRPKRSGDLHDDWHSLGTSSLKDAAE